MTFAITRTLRGFQVLRLDGYQLAQQSSAIGTYQDSFDKPGSSFLWIPTKSDDVQLDREQVRELAAFLLRWCDTGSFEP